MKALLLQLPIPRLNQGLNTGNIPLAGACLKQAADGIAGWEVTLMPEQAVSWAGDQAVVQDVCAFCPDLVGFTVFAWNMERSAFLARQIKEKTGAKLIFGGPQVTEDTLTDFPDFIDFLIIGEGETLFRQILADRSLWVNTCSGSTCSDVRCHSGSGQASMLALGSPYVKGHLDFGPGHVMLLETQRGCPYQCGFCYYSKARKKRNVADSRQVLDGIAWALDNGGQEIYLMDPSLNARPGLKGLLSDIEALNKSKKIPIISEIRAESITGELADLYARAGFTQFEVGLQSTNPAALKIMNRPTDLKRFVTGAKALQERDITVTIDLIFGLPGDTVQRFIESVDFLLDQGLEENVQVFPLLVLPGTAFRKNAGKLGLIFNPFPPYPVIETPGFSRPDMEAALDFAEEAFERAFLPFPDLEISFQGNKKASPTVKDHYIACGGRPLLAKLMLDTIRPLIEIRNLADRISSPFQIFFSGSALDQTYMNRVTAVISEKNPFVPLELVFLTPGFLPDTMAIERATAHKRPHFLDLDQQYLYPEPGNRSILFTLVSGETDSFFQGPMQRQVLLWTHGSLPGLSALDDLAHLDGILIPGCGRDLVNFQDVMAQIHEEILPLCFVDISLQIRWLSLTEQGKYHLPVLSFLS